MALAVEIQSGGITLRDEQGRYVWMAFSEVENVVSTIRNAKTNYVIDNHISNHKSISSVFLGNEPS